MLHVSSPLVGELSVPELRQTKDISYPNYSVACITMCFQFGMLINVESSVRIAI